MAPSKLKLVMGKEGRVDGKNQHGLTIKQLGQLPKAMEQPLAVIGSRSTPGRIVVMTALTDSKGNSMIVPIELDAKGRLKGEYVDAHIATSVYGKKDAANLLMQAAADNEVYYVDAKKCRSFGWKAELQSLGAIPKNGYIRTIPQTATNVNTQSTQGGGKDASGKQFSVEQDGNEAGISDGQETTSEVQQTGDENNGIMKAQPGDEDFVGPVKPEDVEGPHNGNYVGKITEKNLTKELLATKPPYSPLPARWFKDGGQISLDENGVWTYTDENGVSVNYKDGYPDFKSAGVVKQEVKIGAFKRYGIDFKKADKMTADHPRDFDNNTWHHSEDGETLQQIKREIHKKFSHQGGMSRTKQRRTEK